MTNFRRVATDGSGPFHTNAGPTIPRDRKREERLRVIKTGNDCRGQLKCRTSRVRRRATRLAKDASQEQREEIFSTSSHTRWKGPCYVPPEDFDSSLDKGL
jgi:hypothetical protein